MQTKILPFVVIRTIISKQKGWLCDKARIEGGGREKEGDTGTQFWIIADLGEKNSYAKEQKRHLSVSKLALLKRLKDLALRVSVSVYINLPVCLAACISVFIGMLILRC